jgi:hypothetical protein
MDPRNLSDEALDIIYRAANPLDPTDQTVYFNQVLKRLNEVSGPLSPRGITDIVQEVQRGLNRSLGPSLKR